MLPIHPTFTIVGKQLGLIVSDNIWLATPNDLQAIWACLKEQYSGYAAFTTEDSNFKEVVINFDTPEDEVAFKLRFGL